MRPLEYLESWTARDRNLAEALITHEDTRHKCGHDITKSTDPDMDGWFEVDDETVCYACQALERYEKDVKEPQPGVLLHVVNRRPVEAAD